jgi:aminopeptidase N
MSITVTSPTGLEEVSNGRLRSRTDLADGYTRFEWFVANPINNYDVSINIADYVHWKDEYKSKVDNSILSLDYYVLRDNEEKARKQFEQVKPMMDVFEKRFGKYAFYEDGYKLVETPYLGMEHQSCVAYGNAYKNGYMGFDLSGSGEGLKFDYIIIHESAHEWWGNSLTSYDIADMWIHEGFGQYSEVVYLEELYGKQSATNYLNGLKKGVDNKEPIIGPYGVNKEGSGDMYPKGALFLNTLRSVINNDSIWWNCILSLQKDYARKNISTEDVMNLMNAKTGLNLNEYFRQYLYFPNLPVLHLSMTEHKGSTTIKYYWESDSKNFNMPIQMTCKSEKVRLNATNSPQEMTFKKTKKNQIVIDESSFYFKLKND